MRASIALTCVIGAIAVLLATGAVDRVLLRLDAVYFALVVGVTTVAALAKYVLRVQWASALAGAWLFALVLFVGTWPVLACATLTSAALLLGRVVARTRALAVDATVGIVLIAGAAGWILALPVHFAWVWWGLCAAIIAWRFHDARRIAITCSNQNHAAALALLTGLISTACWLPNMQSDDLAYHLALPTQLLEDAVHRPRVDTMLWAFAPWANDTLHGIVAVMSGRVSHGALNAAWLMLIPCLAWQLARTLAGTHRDAAWGAAIALSVPMVGGLATGMHTELPATALSLALCAVAFGPRRRRALFIACVLLGGLFALKLMHGFAALPLACIAFARHRHLRLTACISGMIVGSSAYAQAWLATGNPVFPLGTFVDLRWQHPITWSTPLSLFFDTTRYLESGQGALGIAAIALIVGVVRRRFAAPTIATLAMIVLPFCIVQYARYTLPGVVCFAVVCVVAAMRAAPRKHATAALALCVAMQLLLLPNGNWILSTRALFELLRNGGDAHVVYRKYLPARAVLDAVPPGARVVSTIPDAPYVAQFGARGASVSWYAPRWQNVADAAAARSSPAPWSAMLRDTRAAWVLVDARDTDPQLMKALHELGATQVATEGDAALWHLQ